MTDLRPYDFFARRRERRQREIYRGWVMIVISVFMLIAVVALQGILMSAATSWQKEKKILTATEGLQKGQWALFEASRLNGNELESIYQHITQPPMLEQKPQQAVKPATREIKNVNVKKGVPKRAPVGNIFGR